MKTCFLVLGLSVIGCVALLGQEIVALGGPEPTIPLVALAATGEAKGSAPRAIVRLRVEARGSTLGQAILRNNEFRGQAVKLLMEAGIVRSAIAMERFSSTPEYGKFSGKVKSYTLVNMIEVTISSEDQFLAVAQVVDAQGDLDYQSRRIEFGDETGLEVAAAQKATEALMVKAAAYEKKLGVKLELVSFREVPVSVVGGRHIALPSAPAALGFGSSSRAKVNAAPAAGLVTDFGEAKRIVGVEGLFRLER